MRSWRWQRKGFRFIIFRDRYNFFESVKCREFVKVRENFEALKRS